MYTIIKGDDEFGGGKVLSSSLGGGLILQNDPSSSFCDQREVLIDFTLKDNASNLMTVGKIENPHKMKYQSYGRADTQKVVRPKASESKFQFIDDNPVINLSEGCYKGRVDSTYSQRPYEPVKDDSNSFNSLSRTGEKDDLRMESSLQFNNCDRPIVFEDNQVKEIFSNLMIRKDMEADRILLKEFESNPIFGSEHGTVLQVDKSILNSLPETYLEKNSVNNDDTSESSLLMSLKQSIHGHNQRANTLSSLIIEHGQNLVKKQSAQLLKPVDRTNAKTETAGLVHDQTRASNKPSLSHFPNHTEPKVVSPLTLEEIRVKNLPQTAMYLQQDLEDMSTSHFSHSKQRLIENTTHPYALNQKYSNIKSSVSFGVSNDEIRINELSTAPSHSSMSLRDTSSPYYSSFVETQLDSTSLPSSFNQGHYRLKNNSPSTTLSQEQIIMKNSTPFIVTLESEPVKSDSNSEMEINRTLSHIALSREQLKILASSNFAQGSVQTKNLLPLSNDQELYHSKLPAISFNSQEHDSVRKKLPSPQSIAQLELALKNDSSILEKALNNFRDGNLNMKKTHTSSLPLRTIIQDPSPVKDVHASCSKNIIQENKVKNITSCPLVPNLKRVDNIPTRPVVYEENKIRNFSFPIYDDSLKQSVSEQKHIRGSAFNLGEDEVMDFRLKDGTLAYNASLPSQLMEGLSFHSALKLSREGSNFLRETSESGLRNNLDQTKEPFQNHPSVIAQVGVSCKICNSCRSFYLENGFLIGEESCTLCLYHAKNGMKCVCDHSVMKEEVCRCGREKYGCSYCDKTFPTILLLQRHTFNHISDDDGFVSSDRPDSEPLYTCSVCSSLFSSMTSLEHHMNCHKESHCGTCNRTFKQFNPARHSCEARYLCNLCGAGFASNYNLKMHLLKHSGSLPYKCRECDKSFAKPSELSKHSLVHSGERPYSCDECNMSFTSPTNLRSHKSTHSGRKPHSCQICNKSFTRPADVKRHMVIHTGARPYACEVCGLAFADASNMRKHLATHSKPHQGSDIKTYHCTYCGKMFARPSELKRHFFTHTNTRPYACHICGLAFTDSSNLKKHIQTHERASEQVCLQCDASFKGFTELEMHMALSHGTKRFDSNSGHTCQTCGATFTQLVDLQDHVLSHGSAPSYRCEICSKNFCEQVFLDRHLLTHTESRPFICNECNKSFKSLSHLRSHILIHTGEKSHVCLKCNKSFLKKSSLLRHQGVHVREKFLAMYQFA